MDRKIFDTNTIQVLKAAETHKANLENKYDRVSVIPIGLDRVRIEGKN